MYFCADALGARQKLTVFVKTNGKAQTHRLQSLAAGSRLRRMHYRKGVSFSMRRSSGQRGMTALKSA